MQESIRTLNLITAIFPKILTNFSIVRILDGKLTSIQDSNRLIAFFILQIICHVSYEASRYPNTYEAYKYL